MTTETGAQKIGKKASSGIKQDRTLNDLDRLYDQLLQLKHMLHAYTIFWHEAFDDQLQTIIEQNVKHLKDEHQRIVDQLFEMGEYTADVAPDTQVRDISTVFNGYLNQLPYDKPKPGN